MSAPALALALATVLEHAALPRAAREFLAQYGKPAERAPRVTDRKTLARETLCRRVMELRDTAGSTCGACDTLVERLAAGLESPAIIEAALAVGRAGKPASAPSLKRWAAAYEQSGREALAHHGKGRPRTVWGWETPALQLWLTRGRPDAGAVAYWLRADGCESATYSRVKSFIDALPADLREFAPQRLGEHYHRLNVVRHRIMDHSQTPFGMLYVGDGHTCDFYVRHPRTGKPWRPELTPWIDRRSLYVPGWYLSERESGLTTLLGLSHAILTHGHVPAMIHVDPGSGFKNRMMCAATTGFLARLNIRVMTALPGNARGKGIIEGWFHHFEDRAGKLVSTYCGVDATDDFLRYLTRKVIAGKIVLPTLDDILALIGWYVHTWNTTPKESLGGCTPAELWAKIEKTPPVYEADALLRPVRAAKVRKQRVQCMRRVYEHRDLIHHEGEAVMLKINMHDLRTVLIHDMHDRFICEAHIANQIPGLPISLIDELRQHSLAGVLKRLQAKADEAAARARPLTQAIDEGFAAELEAREAALIETPRGPVFGEEDFEFEDAPEAAPTASGVAADPAREPPPEEGEWRMDWDE